MKPGKWYCKIWLWALKDVGMVNPRHIEVAWIEYCKWLILLSYLIVGLPESLLSEGWGQVKYWKYLESVTVRHT